MTILKWIGIGVVALALGFGLLVLYIILFDDYFDPGRANLDPGVAKEVTRALRAAAVCDRALQGKAGVHAAGDVICFFSPITRNQSAAQFLANPISDNGIVVLRSGGGDVEDALTMAEALLTKQVTVVVAGNCVSSCANYLFLAGIKKIVLANSWVVWHGGPAIRKEYDGPGMTFAAARKLDPLLNRSFEFYERLGVDTGLMYYTPKPGEEQLRIPSSIPQPAWSYPPDVLEHRFGVKGIVYQWVQPGGRFAMESSAPK